MSQSNTYIEIKNIKKGYHCTDGSIKNALNGISLIIKQREVFGLLGVNGAGKTTLSSIIATLHPPTSGDILFNSESIYSDLIAYRSQIGFCSQRSNLDGLLTLEQNLRFAGRYYRMSDNAINERLQKLVGQFELGDYLKKKSSELSGGYCQRFMIARSLMHSPKLVILDEPTVGLDPHIRRQLWSKILELKNDDVTVVLTTHYLDEAEQLADRVCVIDKGSVKLIDTPKNLLADFKKKNLEDVFLELVHETKGEKHE